MPADGVDTAVITPAEEGVPGYGGGGVDRACGAEDPQGLRGGAMMGKGPGLGGTC